MGFPKLDLGKNEDVVFERQHIRVSGSTDCENRARVYVSPVGICLWLLVAQVGLLLWLLRLLGVWQLPF
ncbi:MAG: hypothetical protein ACI4OS_01465 [Akkermansia sp.]